MFQNALTNQGYSTKNSQLLLQSQLLLGSEDLEVAGFKQWLELGRCVAKGQHGTSVYMVVPKKVIKQNGAEEKKPVIKRRIVFFRSQTVELGGTS